VKNCGHGAVVIASSETSSAKVPQKPKFKLNKKFLFFTASALIICVSLALTQSTKAEETLTLARIKSALGGEQAVNSQRSVQSSGQYAGDEAVSALNNFVQQIAAGDPSPAGTASVNSDRQFDDQAYAALRDFAQRLGAAQPDSIKALPKLADATNLFDDLRGSQPKDSAPQAQTPKASKAAKPPVEAHFVGAKTCLTCHAGQTAEFEKTLMGRIGKTQKGKFECENCHGPGSAHVAAGGGRGVGGILSFGATDSRSAEEKNEVCLACHEKGERTAWKGSTHETRGLACTDCHTVMKNVSPKRQLKTAVEMETCFQCHKQKRAQMQRSSHMPVREGKMTCSNCHNPHGSVMGTESLIRQASINDNCYSCHADKRGPFLFEHMPVRENCLNCHDAHGSNHESLLKVARPRLCAQCHGFAHGGQAGMNTTSNAFYTVQHSCNNCHSQIHGSNSPSGAYFHR
jgi:DmsE family decaheme c-type cytochrome